MRFIDEVEITCVSGKGGAGAIAFRREPHVPHGGPSGGDGGRGGDVIIRATGRKNTLDHLRGNRVYRADAGQKGQPKNMHGHGGEDFVILVPVGTIIRDSSGLILADLSVDEAFAVVCRGGIGGRGNSRFATPGNRTPRNADPGGPEAEMALYLELKLLADVGLLGFPNAGKSTFISVVSAARPRVADYPFTTLVPNLGVVTVENEESFVIADIPGLVEGASEGVGLGHQFLRHVERCRLLIHLVSATTFDEPTTDPVERYKVLLNELQVFSPELGRRPQIVVLSKIDACDPDELDKISKRFEEEVGIEPMRLSSPTRQGVKQLVYETWRLLQVVEVDVEEPVIESSVWD